jgi:hypothetical protein
MAWMKKWYTETYINMICYEHYNSNWSQSGTGFTNSLPIGQYDTGEVSQVIVSLIL